MADKPTNYFTEGPGKGFKEGVEDEKMKLLRLIAEHGTTGQRIYDDARRETATQRNADKASIAQVPEDAIRSVAAKYERSLSLFDDVLADNARAAQQDTVRRGSVEALYKDMVAGDASLAQNAQDGIDNFMKAQSGRGRGGGGRGRGGSRNGGVPYGGGPMIPEAIIDGIVGASFDSVHANRAGSQAGDGRHAIEGPGGHSLSPQGDPEKPFTDGGTFDRSGRSGRGGGGNYRQ